jgi:hypothetical protein
MALLLLLFQVQFTALLSLEVADFHAAAFAKLKWIL